MTTLPSKYQIGDRVVHFSDEWANKGIPASVSAVTLYGAIHPGLHKPDYALRFDTPSEEGVIATWHVDEKDVCPLPSAKFKMGDAVRRNLALAETPIQALADGVVVGIHHEVGGGVNYDLGSDVGHKPWVTGVDEKWLEKAKVTA